MIPMISRKVRQICVICTNDTFYTPTTEFWNTFLEQRDFADARGHARHSIYPRPAIIARRKAKRRFVDNKRKNKMNERKETKKIECNVRPPAMVQSHNERRVRVQ
jgi:hypothetical protein